MFFLSFISFNFLQLIECYALWGCIAQLVERWPFKPRVLGSSPSAPNFLFEKVAEWLRRQTVNLLVIPSQVRILFFSAFLHPSSSWFRMLLFHSKNKGSNPLGCSIGGA